MKLNSLYHEDCLLTMGKMPDNFLDMVLTSPPYDDLRNYNNNYSFPFEEIAKELYRVLKPGGIIVWIVADATYKGGETLTSFKQALYFQSIGFTIHDTMIYHKNYFKNSNPNRYYNNFEYMFVLSKGKPKTANLIRDRKNKTAGSKVQGTQRTKDGLLIPKSGVNKKIIQEYGYRGNVWTYAAGGFNSTKDKIAYKHPAIFPESLAVDHIKTWSNAGDVIYDCFAGSGTTGKIAKSLNRNFLMSEIDNQYVSIIEERLNIKKEEEIVENPVAESSPDCTNS